MQWLDDRSRMSGDVHVRFYEHLRGRFPRVTRLVILCQTQEEADNALELARQWVNDKSLALHPDKTHVGNCMVAGQGFEFLGYRFEAGERWVRKKSLKALKDKIRSKTRRSRGDSMETIIKDLNPILKAGLTTLNMLTNGRSQRLTVLSGGVYAVCEINNARGSPGLDVQKNYID